MGIELSDIPVSTNLIEFSEFKPSDIVCSNCNKYKMWWHPWYDDFICLGGSQIGIIYECGKCGHTEYS